MATQVKLSVGGTTNVPSLADQIKRFQPRVFSNTESASRVFDRSAKDNPAREALTIKCVKVIVDNFERLPAHDATGGFNVGYRKYDDENGDRRQDETKDGGGGGGGGVDASPATAAWSAAKRTDPAGRDAGFGGMGEGDGGETKLEGDDELPHPQQQEGRVIPAKFLQLISAGLSTDLDPKVGALYVFDENYWKRRCVEKLGWQNCQIAEHGLTWKQLFFEAHVSTQLETFDAQKETFDHLLEFLASCQEYVFTLRIRQLLAHPDMRAVCEVLQNLTMDPLAEGCEVNVLATTACVYISTTPPHTVPPTWQTPWLARKLDVTYSVSSIGMKYERMLFGMKISDANCLAKAIQATQTMASLVLQGNLIDDDLMRMLMTGLIRNSTITYLDVSHNKITNHGARLLSKLLGENSVLTTLNLADNQIHAEGGRYIGRALRGNTSLVTLNLRLNRLTDEGGKMLVEGLHDNRTLACLNLSANSIAREACSSLSMVLRKPGKVLATLDLSCNELQDDDIRLLCVALERNSSLTSIDLRMNDVSADLENLEKIEVGRRLAVDLG
ncbi:unnamed protein product [Ectocarpus sp. CCAP 1310/34]|nr:unnamed protein product [Ectocarpus sp. CCAP 1310/34]